jgi:hypothetical protein
MVRSVGTVHALEGSDESAIRRVRLLCPKTPQKIMALTLNRRFSESAFSDGCGQPVPGIVISRACDDSAEGHPRIQAFVWGGKVRPEPALPYGRRRLVTTP